MKVLILEDEFHVLKGAFDYLSSKFYNGQLQIENHPKSQDVTSLKDADTYDRIFVDINLHRNSIQDGYAFIRSLQDHVSNLKKIVIITGSDKVAEKLVEEGLPKIDILKKPITFLDLKRVMP